MPGPIVIPLNVIWNSAKRGWDWPISPGPSSEIRATTWRLKGWAQRWPTTPSPWQSELRIPSSAQALLELRLGDWGHDALGYVAHVPHYLAQLDYPVSALALVEHLERGAHLTVDLSDMRAVGEEREAEIARYLAANEEVEEVVRALEQQYDTFREAEESGRSLLASDEPLPTGDEIGRQFEQFLAGLEEPGDATDDSWER